MELEQQETVGELVDPEDLPLGETVWVARDLDLAFDGRLDSFQSVPLASAIDTSEFVSAVLMLVVHSQTAWTSKATIWLRALAVELDACEPETMFTGPVVAEIDVQQSQAPAVRLAALSVVPPRVMVRLEWGQGEEEGTAPQTARISAALVVRRHVAPTYRVSSSGLSTPRI